MVFLISNIQMFVLESMIHPCIAIDILIHVVSCAVMSIFIIYLMLENNFLSFHHYRTGSI